MRPAPPLALQCSPSRAWRLSCTAVGTASGLALAAWVAGHLEWPLAALLAALAATAAGGAALGRFVAGPRVGAHLAWDGQRWWVDGVPGDLQLMLDLDRWLLLLRHRPHGEPGGQDGQGGQGGHGRAGRPGRRRTRWVAVSFRRGADDLRVLRTALYSPPPEATPKPPHVRAPDRATD